MCDLWLFRSFLLEGTLASELTSFLTSKFKSQSFLVVLSSRHNCVTYWYFLSARFYVCVSWLFFKSVCVCFLLKTSWFTALFSDRVIVAWRVFNLAGNIVFNNYKDYDYRFCLIFFIVNMNICVSFFLIHSLPRSCCAAAFSRCTARLLHSAQIWLNHTFKQITLVFPLEFLISLRFSHSKHINLVWLKHFFFFSYYFVFFTFHIKETVYVFSLFKSLSVVP